MKNHSEFLTVAIQVAMQAGDLLKKGFGTTYEISSKAGMHNLVTFYDKASEEMIFSALQKRFPTHGFVGEEQGQTKKGDVMWIVDPLDGTVNFAHGVPMFSVSIAAAIGNEVVAGCVFQPMTNELFWAEKGKGSFLNGAQLQVTKRTSLKEVMLATGFPYNVNENPYHCIDTFLKLQKQGIPIRRLGSAAIDLSYVAAGRYDAYWEVNLQPWDFAAGMLIVHEAGGKVTLFDGSPCDLTQQGTILSSNGLLHPLMMEELK
jgi:myo-inositol-1(or 4)-monophosphatase